jgi:hypothetical protein
MYFLCKEHFHSVYIVEIDDVLKRFGLPSLLAFVGFDGQWAQ